MMRISVLVAGLILSGIALTASSAEAADHRDEAFANARSLCSESGLNDPADESALERLFGDPGGIVQSYGFSVGWGGVQDPENADPKTGRGTPIPGSYCNPTHFDFSGPE